MENEKQSSECIKKFYVELEKRGRGIVTWIKERGVDKL